MRQNDVVKELKKLFPKELLAKTDDVQVIELLASDSKRRTLKRLKRPTVARLKNVELALIHLILQLSNGSADKSLISEVKRYWIPIADNFGMWKLRYLLEDQWFLLSDPKEYNLIKSLRKKSKRMHDILFKDIKDILSFKLKQEGIKKFDILFRKKNIFGVYEKMKRRNLNINHITDLFAMRIIVDRETDCYQVMEVLHYLWPPYRNKIKDYIKNPKPNGYKSLHTTLHCIDRQTVEFQIRTAKMDHVAKFGRASHATYKKSVRRI